MTSLYQCQKNVTSIGKCHILVSALAVFDFVERGDWIQVKRGTRCATETEECILSCLFETDKIDAVNKLNWRLGNTAFIRVQKNKTVIPPHSTLRTASE